jgi:hypothetical protein
MPMKKYKPEQIVTLLRQIEVEIANGKTSVLRKNSTDALESLILMFHLAVCTVVFHSSEPRREVASSSTPSSSV